jgi:2-polyprenyl-3-methyl-5-hydroxy-6-metoxy-1,4-benzoquinol methylase
MQQEVMPKKHWIEKVRAHAAHLPFVINPRDCFDEHQLHQRYLKDVNGGRIFEVGCAPGGWLTYFARNFGLQAHGIEYVEEGAQLTRHNLSLQGIEGKIISGDFFTSPLPSSHYDVVFTRGFIEHFTESQAVVNRLAGLARIGGIIVTTVPNFLGLNGLIRKRFAPESYAAHVKIDIKQLREMHEASGLNTCFCDYAGVPTLILPWDASAGGTKPTSVAGRAMDMGKRILNRLVRQYCTTRSWVPRSLMLSPTMVYIGRLELSAR